MQNVKYPIKTAGEIWESVRISSLVLKEKDTIKEITFIIIPLQEKIIYQG